MEEFMGFKVRKSVKIAPGVRLNVGKKSSGISVGGKYGGVSYNSKTGARARVSAPGTGVSYSTNIGSSSKKTSNKKQVKHNTVENNTKNDFQPKKLASKASYKISYILFMVLAIFCLLIGILIPEALFFIIIAIIFFAFGCFYRKIYKNYNSYL